MSIATSPIKSDVRAAVAYEHLSWEELDVLVYFFKNGTFPVPLPGRNLLIKQFTKLGLMRELPKGGLGVTVAGYKAIALLQWAEKPGLPEQPAP